jgi:hypothetical protein
MKKLLLILLCLPMIGFGQQTYVPDDIFEAHLEANGIGNGIPNDDSVTTSNISNETYLVLYNMNISDLTGIEDFLSLTNLNCRYNQLTSIDVSNSTALTYLGLDENQLTSLDVSNNPALTYLNCSDNQLSSLDVSNNTALVEFNCGDNQITSLDVSNSTALVELACYNNQLSNLDVRNGNNTNMSMYTHNNPNLTCINVDDSTWSANNWTIYDGNINSQHYFSTNCPPSAIQEHTTNKELLKVTDLLGRETKPQTNTPFIEIYDDGTVEKRIIIE